MQAEREPESEVVPQDEYARKLFAASIRSPTELPSATEKTNRGPRGGQVTHLTLQKPPESKIARRVEVSDPTAIDL